MTREDLIREEIKRVRQQTGGVEVIFSDNEKSVTLGAMQSEAILFAEWLKTFGPLEKKDGQWVLESQLSSERLYSVFNSFREDSPI